MQYQAVFRLLEGEILHNFNQINKTFCYMTIWSVLAENMAILSGEEFHIPVGQFHFHFVSRVELKNR